MKRHMSMSPMTLRASRKEYSDFELGIFRQHIYQEVRRQKFVYFLNVKRAEKQKQQRNQLASNVMPPRIAAIAHKSLIKRGNLSSIKEQSISHKRTTKTDTVDMA